MIFKCNHLFLVIPYFLNLKQQDRFHVIRYSKGTLKQLTIVSYLASKIELNVVLETFLVINFPFVLRTSSFEIDNH